MANYYADRIRIGSGRNLGNEVTRETPQKVELGLGSEESVTMFCESPRKQ